MVRQLETYIQVKEDTQNQYEQEMNWALYKLVVDIQMFEISHTKTWQDQNHMEVDWVNPSVMFIVGASVFTW